MQKTKRILVLLLVTALTVMQLPAVALATSAGEGGEIIAFDTLPKETADQTVALGASLGDLNLPNTLNATVRVVAEDTKAPEPEAGGEQPESEPDKPEMMEVNIPIPVKWVSSPDYDGEITGTYTFTAQIGGFTVSAASPSITVTVGEITGTVTAFKKLPDEIRWQNTTAPQLPAELAGTVEGEAVQIPVTWQTEQDYDENAPKRGLYVFDAMPGERYTLAGGVEVPRITVYIPDTVSRFAPFRMGGGGTTASPLEITTIAQLAEIAELVNAGRLESFLLNDASAKVYLKLMNDLDLSAYGQDYNSGKGWKPIGFYNGISTIPFKGSFNGGGHTISGLYINDNTREYAGLFGIVQSATVENLNLTAVSIRAKNCVGGIAGYAYGTGNITDCRVSGSVSGRSNIGGIIGTTYSTNPTNYSMSRCSFEGSVSGSVSDGGNNIGGLAGTAKDITISYSYASGAVSGNMQVGGLVGQLEVSNGKLQNCYATGKVKGTQSVGGLTGSAYGKNIENCAALNSGVEATTSNGGRVTGDNYAVTLAGNAAFNDMAVGVSGSAKAITSDATGVDGEGITTVEIKTDGSIIGRFTAANGWTVENGKLPGFGAAVDIPEYITGYNDPNFPGAGTAAEPFLIRTAEELAKLAELVNNPATNATYGGPGIHYKLTADLDLSGYGVSNTSFNSGKGWVPIGTAYSFRGDFNGGGKTITGLYINDAGFRNAGLFGDSTGSIHDLHLEAVCITAEEKVGGIAGQLSYVAARIERCSVSGTITGKYDVGGIAGYVVGTMTNCFSACDVTGQWQVGGVAGNIQNAGGSAATDILSCYAIGTVIGTSGGGNIGGVAGRNTGNVRNCAALNPTISGLNYVGRVVGRNDGTLSGNVAFSDMIGGGSYKSETGLDGADTCADALQSASGLASAFTAAPWTYIPGSLPGLFGKTVDMPAHITAKQTDDFAGGNGSWTNPYQIATAAQLAKLAELVNVGGYDGKYYRLTADIDLSGYGKNYGGGKGWVPIGTEANPFRGEFDGNGKVISGLYINRPDEDYIGLFGYISHTVIDYMREPSSVRNLGIVNANIIGRDIVGGLAGQFGSGEALLDMADNYVTGSISGNHNVGGLAGYVDWTHVASCYSTAMVTGNDNVGGLLGYTHGTAVQRCYATGSVTGNDKVGGLIGEGASADNCVTLNPSINGSTVNIGRIAGTISSYNLSNYAFSGMKVNGGTVSSADSKSKDGVDITLAQANTAAFWGNDWGSNGWTLTDGKLPILAGFPAGAQSGDGGLYLTERDIANATLQVGTGELIYNGSLIEPTLTVTFDGETLVKGTDYIIEVADESASNGTNAGTVTANLVGKGNFKGETGLSYTIRPKELTVDMLTTTGFIYTGKAQKPAVTDGGITLVENADYTAIYANNINAGTANVSVTGKGNYTGTLSKTFTIAKAPLTITGGTVAAKTYNGTNTAYVTDVSFGGLQNGETLTWGDDYTVTGAQFDSAEAGENKTLTATVALESTEATDNYTLTSENLSLTNLSISKAAAPTGVNQMLEVPKNHSQDYAFDLTTLLPAISSPKSLGTVAYVPSITANSDGVLSSLNYTSGNTLTIPVNSIAAANKTATIKVTVKSTNYADFDAVITVKTVDVDTVNIAAITGITAPVRGEVPVTAISQTAQYTGTVTWHPVHDPFAPSTVYTATITLTPKAGYTLTGVAANFFTVAGATSVSNEANSGVITATFPITDEEGCLVTYQGAQTRYNEGSNTYDIRFVATIDTLEAKEVGFVFSKSETTPTRENASEKATSTVYEEITALDLPVTAESLGGEYIIACTVTGIPAADSEVPLYVRAFSTVGTETKYTSVRTVTVSGLLSD